MKRFSLKLVASAAAMAVLIAAAGCGSSMPSVPGLGNMSSTALKSSAGLYNQLGGAQGVAALSEAFGQKLSIDPSVTKFLDAGAIDAVEGGLTNTLAALGGQKLPSDAPSLLSTLEGKNLDTAAVGGVSKALQDAGKEKNLNPTQLGLLGSITDSVDKELLD